MTRLQDDLSFKPWSPYEIGPFFTDHRHINEHFPVCRTRHCRFKENPNLKFFRKISEIEYLYRLYLYRLYLYRLYLYRLYLYRLYHYRLYLYRLYLYRLYLYRLYIYPPCKSSM